MTAPAGLSAAEVEALRKEFPILARRGRGGAPIAYLDSSATSQKPQSVIDAESHFYAHSNGAVNRGTHLLADEATEIYEDTRGKLARFVGADPDEIAWTKNATEAFNVIAFALLDATLAHAPLAIKPGERIVVTRAEHHANLVPWQRLADRVGAEFAWLDLTPDGRIDLDTLDVITPNTRVVAFTHLSNVTGAFSPVDQIVAAARNVGALVVLDTCQSSAHLPLNVHELDVDVAAFSAHKMCGPTGIGALYVRRSVGEQLPPALTGGSMVADVAMDHTEFQPVPLRFEAGTQPVAQIAGWSAALDFLARVGMDRLAEHERQMTAYLMEGLASVDGLRIIGPASAADRAAVPSFTLGSVHPHDIGQILDASDVAIRVGHHCAIPLHRFFGVRASARASAAVTTTTEEIDRLIAALEQVRQFFVR